MKYLLDTHIWFWSYIERSRISKRVARALADPQNELWLSPVSVWELTILIRKGRFRVQPDISTWVRKSMSDLQLFEAPLTVDVALAIPSINFSHGDPADQFLAATAKVFDLTLITADDHLLKLPGIRILANR
ncbi:MAG TPA: type II toxin-antitoxin system VapC family toxin [Candidatus Binatia bacterium]|jgi:PIN domain nuclease of toxin-antitoxin system|nr:type II toxin-antitoxin system VapC family toxin [Candidatus Binatia bacterium]